MCRAQSATDFYALLGVSSSATFTEIRGAYRRAALRTHPDKGGDSTAFQLVAVAFDTLSHEPLRAAYDRRRARADPSLSGTTQSAAAPQQAEVPSEPRCVRPQQPPEPRHARRPDLPGTAPKESAPPDIAAEGLKSEGKGLRKALERLRCFLKGVAPERRRLLLDSMKEEVRSRLLKFMQFRAAAAQSGRFLVLVGSGSSTSSSESLASADSDGPWTSDAKPLLRIEDNLHPSVVSWSDGPVTAAGNDAAPEPERYWAPRARGVHTVQTKTKGLRHPLYRGVLRFTNLTVFTRYQRNFDTAVDHHILLVQIRRACMGGMQRDISCRIKSDEIRKAFDVVFTERGTSAQELGVLVMTEVSLLPGSWNNGVNFSVRSPTASLSEALDWRDRMLAVRFADWEVFRLIWVELLQSPQWKTKAMDAQDAQAFVNDQWKKVEPYWRHREASGGGRFAHREVMDDGDRRFARLVQSVSRHMAAEAATARRQTLEEERLRQRLSRDRWRWATRKDATTAEILGGFPPHLRDPSARERRS